MVKQKEKDKFGLISLILGIVSVLFMLIGFAVSFVGFFGFILMILTFIFSGIQLKKNKNNLAVAGLILAFVALGFFLLDSVLTASIQNGGSDNNFQINCEYKSYDSISSQIRMGMTKSEIVRIFGNADSVYATNLGAGSPCRSVDVLRYSCSGETTAIGFCDGEYVGSIQKE